MTSLHIINDPVSDTPDDGFLRMVRAGDAIILIESAVLMLRLQTGRRWLENLDDAVRVYSLAPDQLARGLADVSHSAVTPLDYSGFVALTLEHDKTISWCAG